MSFIQLFEGYPSKKEIFSTLKNSPKIKESLLIEEQVLKCVAKLFAKQTLDVQMVIPLVKEALTRAAFPTDNEEKYKAAVELLKIAMLNLGKIPDHDSLRIG